MLKKRSIFAGMIVSDNNCGLRRFSKAKNQMTCLPKSLQHHSRRDSLRYLTFAHGYLEALNSFAGDKLKQLRTIMFFLMQKSQSGLMFHYSVVSSFFVSLRNTFQNMNLLIQ